MPKAKNLRLIDGEIILQEPHLSFHRRIWHLTLPQVAGLHRAVPSTTLDKVFNCIFIITAFPILSTVNIQYLPHKENRNEYEKSISSVAFCFLHSSLSLQAVIVFFNLLRHEFSSILKKTWIIGVIHRTDFKRNAVCRKVLLQLLDISN